MNLTSCFYKAIYICMFCVFTSTCAQTVEKFKFGTMYWGAFNASEQKIEGELEFRAPITHIEKASDKTRTYYYLITGIDPSGKNFKLNLYGEVNKPQNFFDDDNLQYTVVGNDDEINILCLKKLPKGNNLYLYMKIDDIKQ